MTPDELKIAVRIAARKKQEAIEVSAVQEAKVVIGLITETAVRLGDGNKNLEAATRFLETIYEHLRVTLLPPELPQLSIGRAAHRVDRSVDASDVQQAMEIIEEMEELMDEIPSAGMEFAEDVMEKARSISKTIELARSVTPAQAEALSNMRNGLARWIRD